MSNVAKLKKAGRRVRAQEDSSTRRWRSTSSFSTTSIEYADELDVALFNRVGDLMLRQGNVADAVDYYERQSTVTPTPGSSTTRSRSVTRFCAIRPAARPIYYKLGKISAQKGFKTDAKQNFLEYADRMQKAGKSTKPSGR